MRDVTYVLINHVYLVRLDEKYALMITVYSQRNIRYSKEYGSVVGSFVDVIEGDEKFTSDTGRKAIVALLTYQGMPIIIAK